MTQTIGQAVQQATRFLLEFYKDTAEMVGTLERMLGSKGYTPWNETRIDVLSNSLQKPHRWVLRGLFRTYLPSRDSGQKDAIVFLLVTHPKGLVGAQCLVVHAQFQKLPSHKQLWDRWVDGTQVMVWMNGKSGVEDIPDDMLKKDVLPDAVSARALMLPVDELGSRGDLQTKILDRLLP